MSDVLGLPTLDDLTLLWEAIDVAEDVGRGDFIGMRSAHARVLTYLMDNGLFERSEATCHPAP